MTQVAVLGMGAMGARMAAALIRHGHAVTVWNRTPGRAPDGASVVATPRQAAKAAAFVFAMLRDDSASRDVWLDPETGALAGMDPGAVAIDSATLTPDWVRALAALASARGVAFLDAPVAGSRPQADAGQLIFFVGGDAAVLARAEPLLRSMGGAVHHAGPVGAGATVKLAVNALFAVQVAAVAELIGLLQATRLDVAHAVEIMGATPVCSGAAKAAASGMLANAFAPQFPVSLVEKDLGYLAAVAMAHDARVPIAEAAAAVMRAAAAAGWRDDNLTGVVRLYRDAANADAPEAPA